MRALSLWQPWASLWAAGIKRNETRGRLTHVRGPVAIHAAKLTHMQLADKIGATAYFKLSDICMDTLGVLISDLPRGCVVGTVGVVECRHIGDNALGMPLLLDREPKATRMGHGELVSDLERSLGDYSPGRYAWIGRNHVVVEPLPWKGSQGFFDVPADLLHKARPGATS